MVGLELVPNVNGLPASNAIEESSSVSSSIGISPMLMKPLELRPHLVSSLFLGHWKRPLHPCTGHARICTLQPH